MAQTTIRLLSFNIHKGFSAFGGQFTLARIREMLRTSGADVVCLQEVQGEHKKFAAVRGDYPKESQFEYLADTVWSHYSYGRNAVYDEGHHGNAVLSKFPLVSVENIDISTNRFERRGLLHAVCEWPGGRIHVMNVHLNLFESGRQIQFEHIAERVAKAVPAHEPMILAGDFNDWRGKANDILKERLGLTEAHTELFGRPARTFPARLPVLALDRIYYRGLKLKRVEVLAQGGWSKLSDHVALLAEFVVT